MKVAIVHDWLVNYGGAETVVELWLKMFPEAEIFTLVYDKKKMKNHFENVKIHTSGLQKLPCSTKIYTKLLKFMPKAFESFDFSGFDLVLCSSSSCAKGVIVPPYIPHIAYIHSPMRYAWDLFFDYKKRSGKLTQHFMNKWMHDIRTWDYISSQRPDTLIANSKYISRRIKRFWNRDSVVINAPIDNKRFYPDPEVTKREDYYVFFSRLVAYKRADLAIKACMKLNKKLIVIGGGSEEQNLKELAKSDSNIIFTGRASDKEVLSYLQKCKALLFCAEEDFGLVPIEAQACGSPVIAFGRGGALETVVQNKTGIFFKEQTEESLEKAILEFEALDEKGTFLKENMIKQASNFSQEKFISQINQVIEETRNKIAIKY